MRTERTALRDHQAAAFAGKVFRCDADGTVHASVEPLVAAAYLAKGPIKISRRNDNVVVDLGDTTVEVSGAQLAMLNLPESDPDHDKDRV